MKALLLLVASIGFYHEVLAQCPSNKPTQPSTQFTGVADPSGTIITLNWTRGNGQGRVIVAKQNSPVDVLPSDCLATSEVPVQLFSFGMGKNLGNGNYVVAHLSNSTPDQTPVLILTPGATYHFAIVELNYVSEKFDFLLNSIARTNQTTTSCVSNEPTIASSNLGISSVSSNRLAINWTAGNGQQRIGVLTTAGSSVFTPVDIFPITFSSYATPNTVDFNQALNLIPGNFLVYNGSTSSFYLENLPQSSSFTLRIYEFNTCQHNFLTSSKLERTFSTCAAKPTIQTTSLTATNITPTSMRISWTNGNGNTRLVVVKQAGNGSFFVPTDCVVPSSTSGSIEATGNSTDLIGLTPGQNYDITVYEGNTTTSPKFPNYLTTNAPSISVSTQPCNTNEPTVQSSNLSFTNITTSSVTLNWINGNGAKRVVLARAGDIPTDIGDFFPYEVISNYISSNFSQAPGRPDGTRILYQGSGSSLNVTGLYLERFHFKIIEFNSTTCGNDHFFNNPATNSVCIALNQPDNLISPSGSVVACYQPVLLRFTGAGYDPMSTQFQWFKRIQNQTDIIISGATSANYTATESGDYVLKIVGPCSTVTSTPVSVAINSPVSATFNQNSTFCGTNVEVVINPTSGNPNMYSINWDSNVNSAGVADVPETPLINNRIQLNLPNTYRVYSGYVHFNNSVTSCSQSYPITITTKISHTINFPTIVSKSYGSTPFTLNAYASNLPITYTSSNSEVASVSGKTVTVHKPGTATITASQSGAYAYCPAPDVSQVLQVNKATLTASTTNASRTYGAANPTFGITYTGFVNGETASVIDSAPIRSTTATVTSNTGTYPITISGGTDNNYTFTYGAPATLTVTKASLTATSNATKVYGAANPAFPITYSGLLNGETAAVIDTQPTATTAATVLSNVGSYPVTLTGGSDNNYTITNQTGSLSVTKRDITATAVSTSKYVGQPNPPFSINYTGFVNGENSSVLDVKPVASTTATTSSPVGSYPINLSGGSDNNYAYTYVNGVLTVSPVPTCSFYISSTGDLCTEGRIQLRVNATSGTPATYLWSTGLTTSRIPIHWGGTYSVTVTFSNGCTQTESFYVADPVGPGCIYYLKAEPLQFLQTSEYPNPVDAELTIEIASDLLETNTTDIPVNLIDPTGKSAFTSSFKKDTNQIKISTQNMPAGLYVLQIGSGKTGVVRKKVMVVH